MEVEEIGNTQWQQEVQFSSVHSTTSCKLDASDLWGDLLQPCTVDDHFQGVIFVFSSCHHLPLSISFSFICFLSSCCLPLARWHISSEHQRADLSWLSEKKGRRGNPGGVVCTPCRPHFPRSHPTLLCHALCVILLGADLLAASRCQAVNRG